MEPVGETGGGCFSWCHERPLWPRGPQTVSLLLTLLREPQEKRKHKTKPTFPGLPEDQDNVGECKGSC